MAESREDPVHSRNVDEARDDLAQASLALNNAYDRLQDLRTSLRNFTAYRDRLTNERARQANRLRRGTGSMAPNHSAIVFSDSDDDSEIDMDLLRETLPARLLELTSRWSSHHARLIAARESASAERNGSEPTAGARPPEEPRTAHPPLRRRRALPQGASPRDSGMSPPGPLSPARRSILEAHFRHLRHVSNPSESSTTLGRRVAQRVAQSSSTASQAAASGTPHPSDTVVYSTLPLGIERRPPTSNLESRAASHLRYSLLPNPPAGMRISSGSRTGTATGGAHPRLNERSDHRPRMAQGNSVTSTSRIMPSASTVTQHANPLDTSLLSLLSTRLGQLRNTVASSPSEDSAGRREGTSEHDETPSGTYRVRRRLNADGEEHVFSINWGDLISDADGEIGLPEGIDWWRPSRQPSRARASRTHSAQDAETDDTVVQESVPFLIHEGQERSTQRSRRRTRLNADGDEVSTEGEGASDRSRAEPDLRVRGTRERGSSTVANGEVSRHDSHDFTIIAPDFREFVVPDGTEDDACESVNTTRSVINSMFRLPGAVAAYTSPLPMPIPVQYVGKSPDIFGKEVRVRLEGNMAGR